MGLIVQKFGGTSVKDRDRIFNVARIVPTPATRATMLLLLFLPRGIPPMT